MFIRKALIILAISSLSHNIFSQTFEAWYDISYPSTTYFMQGTDNTIFFQAISRRWHPCNNYVRASYKNIDIQTDKKVTISKIKDGDILQLDLIDGMTFDTIRTLKSTIKAGIPKTGNKEVTVQFFGDSYTQGEYFKYAFLESGMVPKVKLLGTRNINGYESHGHEGRGGWTVNQYCRTETGEYYYNPFYQPEGKYKYWGSTAFWKNCFKVLEDRESCNFEQKYFCSKYNLDEYNTDGKRKYPKEMDLMWDSESDTYIVWNKGSWKKLNEKLNWSFNYPKYLEMNSFKSPDFMIFMLGLNDFRNGNLNPDFKSWNRKVMNIANSYLTSNPNGKFVICIPCSSCGSMNNKSGVFTARQNAIMWEVRKNIIDNFQGKESNGIFVVDASATIDNENGYNNENGIQTGNPHPYPDYPQIGMSVAAFVQYYRDK